MPTKTEKDAISGRDTTGHEWDGIRELDTPLPKWWLYTWYACILYALGMFVVYPSIPYGTGYFHGLIGYSQRKMVDADVGKLVAKRNVAMDTIAADSFAQIKADPALLEVALTSGRITFAENCQPCHGAGGAGNPGYPALAAGAWIWGGTLQDIQLVATQTRTVPQHVVRKLLRWLYRCRARRIFHVCNPKCLIVRAFSCLGIRLLSGNDFS